MVDVTKGVSSSLCGVYFDVTPQVKGSGIEKEPTSSRLLERGSLLDGGERREGGKN
jgi:hypothetical protein